MCHFNEIPMIIEACEYDCSRLEHLAEKRREIKNL